MGDGTSEGWTSPDVGLVGRTISHFRIVERIGKGGMGEVYEAEDTRLRRRVALKVLNAEWASSDKLRRRLIREARSAAALSHPNIAVIHEVDEVDGVPFIAMERLAGRNLRSILASAPPAIDESMRIGIEIARGLAHAHRMHVVHRDLKPENINVEPDGRVKILDFGLAKSFTDLAGPASAQDEGLISTDFTAEGAFVGTPAYASPEQLRGLAVGAASDVFSFGVVLYEMLIGTHPFRRPTPAETASAILGEKPPPLRNSDGRLPQDLERVVARCLDKNPGARFPSAVDVVAALEEVRRGGATAGFRAPARRRTTWTIAGAGLTLLVLLAWLVVQERADAPRWSSDDRDATSARAFVQRRDVAVLGFQNLSGRPDAAWLSTALSEMLTAELTGAGGLRTIPGDEVARMKSDLTVSEASSLGKRTLSRIRGHLRADFVVIGSYVDLGDRAGGKIRLDLRLQDTRDGVVVLSIVQTGTQDDLFDLVALAGVELRGALGVEPVAAVERAALRQALPAGPEATRLYAEGLDALRRFDALAARELLERSVALDDDRAATHAALASAWKLLGYETRQREAARRAFDLSTGMPRAARLSIEGALRVANGEWDRALEVHRALWDSSPGDVEYALRLARVQTRSGSGRDALATIDRLRSLAPAPDPRIDLEEAEAASSLADMKHAATAAARAAAHATDIGSSLVAAHAKVTEGWALGRLGEPSAARAALEEARDIFAAAGDRGGAARAMGNLAVLLREQGDDAGSIATFERAEKIARDIGHQGALSTVLNNLANVHYRNGDLDRAESLYRQALEIDREIDNRVGIPHRLGNLANVLSDRGKLREARSLHQQALAGFESMGDRAAAARTLNNLGNLDLQEGRISSARARFDEVIARQRQLDLKRDLVYGLENLGATLLVQDELAGARRSLEEALRIREELGEGRTIVETRVLLGSVALEEGAAAEAERAAAEAADYASQAQDAALQRKALILLGEARLRQGRLPEAERAIADVAPLATDEQGHSDRITATLLRARIHATSGRLAEARRELGAGLAEARQSKLAGLELESRLAEIEIASRAGDAVASRIVVLERDARAAGFLLIARKCGALGRSEAAPGGGVSARVNKSEAAPEPARR